VPYFPVTPTFLVRFVMVGCDVAEKTEDRTVVDQDVTVVPAI